MTKQQAKTRSDLVSMANGKIYILHGWTYALDKWVNFTKEFESKGFETNLLKIPGLTGKINKPWSIEDYKNWLYKKIENEKDVVLVGHSNGGRIAMAFAIAHPQKVRKLILIDSAGIYHNELPLKIKRAVFKTIAKIGKILLLSEKAKGLLYFLAGEKDYKNASPNMKKTMVNLIKSDKTLEINQISVPTIIIWGQNDGATPVSDGKILNAKIKNSRLFLVKGGRHSPQFTHPKEVVRIIVEQLNNIAM